MSLLYFVIVAQFFTSSDALVHSLINRNYTSGDYLTTPEIIRKYDYPVECQHVVTEDGYILELHRIPYGRNDVETSSSLRPPVLVVHCLQGSSADWVLLGPNRSLAFILADAGYDVWLGNNRGNIYSRTHKKMSTSDRRYWDFSYHELGVYDVPAMIDHILDRTKREKLYYIGHSQGTAQFWVTMSQRPSYNSKVSLMIGLGPVAYTGHMRGKVTALMGLTPLGVSLGETFGYSEWNPRFTWGKTISDLLCQEGSSLKKYFCINLFVLADFNQTQLSAHDRKLILDHVPAGASWKEPLHFGQGYIHKDHFRQFDYNNDAKNYRLYHSLVPPEYELNKVIAPVALFSSDDDVLADTEDVELLTEKLSNIVDQEKVEGFSHFDFLWGKYSVTLVFEPIVKLLARYK